MVNERRWLVLIFALYFFLAVGYSLLMPLWEAPMKARITTWHGTFIIKTYIATPEKNYEASQPRLFYYLGSLVLRAVDKIDPDLTTYYFPKEYKYNIRVPERQI